MIPHPKTQKDKDWNQAEKAFWKLDRMKNGWPYRKRLCSEQVRENYLNIAKSGYWAFRYARDNIKGRWKPGEIVVKSDISTLWRYIEEVVKGPWPEVEDLLVNSPYYSYRYANFLGKRWPEAESAIQKNFVKFAYTEGVIKGRWLEIEPEVLKRASTFKRYLQVLARLKVKIPEEWVWKLAFYKGLKRNLPLLNRIGMCPEIQEHVIQVRPDLIDRIWNLDPELKVRYGHEIELSRVDL